MRLISWLLLLLAFAAGIASAFGVAYLTFDAKPVQVVDRGPTVKILVAKKEIPKGSEIEANDIAFVDVPITEIPTESIMNFMQAYRRRPAYPIPVGCPICEDLLLKATELPTEEAKFVPAGSRLVSLEIEQLRMGESTSDVQVPISKLLGIGDRVDVRVVPRKENRGIYVERKNQVLREFAHPGETPTEVDGALVLSDVPVHSLSSKSETPNKGEKQIQSLSLLLENQDADKLLNAAKEGRIRIVPHPVASTAKTENHVVEVSISPTVPVIEPVLAVEEPKPISVETDSPKKEIVRLRDSSRIVSPASPTERATERAEQYGWSSIDLEPANTGAQVSFIKEKSPKIIAPVDEPKEPKPSPPIVAFAHSKIADNVKPTDDQNSTVLTKSEPSPKLSLVEPVSEKPAESTAVAVNRVNNYSPFGMSNRLAATPEEDKTAEPAPPLKLRPRGTVWK